MPTQDTNSEEVKGSISVPVKLITTKRVMFAVGAFTVIMGVVVWIAYGDKIKLKYAKR
jgi:hypothetical protein